MVRFQYQALAEPVVSVPFDWIIAAAVPVRTVRRPTVAETVEPLVPLFVNMEWMPEAYPLPSLPRPAVVRFLGGQSAEPAPETIVPVFDWIRQSPDPWPTPRRIVRPDGPVEPLVPLFVDLDWHWQTMPRPIPPRRPYLHDAAGVEPLVPIFDDLDWIVQAQDAPRSRRAAVQSAGIVEPFVVSSPPLDWLVEQPGPRRGRGQPQLVGGADLPSLPFIVDWYVLPTQPGRPRARAVDCPTVDPLQPIVPEAEGYVECPGPTLPRSRPQPAGCFEPIDALFADWLGPISQPWRLRSRPQPSGSVDPQRPAPLDWFAAPQRPTLPRSIPTFAGTIEPLSQPSPAFDWFELQPGPVRPRPMPPVSGFTQPFLQPSPVQWLEQFPDPVRVQPRAQPTDGVEIPYQPPIEWQQAEAAYPWPRKRLPELGGLVEPILPVQDAFGWFTVAADLVRAPARPIEAGAVEPLQTLPIADVFPPLSQPRRVPSWPTPAETVEPLLRIPFEWWTCPPGPRRVAPRVTPAPDQVGPTTIIPPFDWRLPPPDCVSRELRPQLPRGDFAFPWPAPLPRETVCLVELPQPDRRPKRLTFGEAFHVSTATLPPPGSIEGCASVRESFSGEACTMVAMTGYPSVRDMLDGLPLVTEVIDGEASVCEAFTAIVCVQESFSGQVEINP